LSTIITLTGITGSGKTTIARALLETLPDTRMVPSLTTRAPRPSDLPGEYRHPTRSEMAKLRARKTRGDQELLWTRDRDNGTKTYATAREDVLEALSSEGGYRIMILVPDVLRILYWFIVEDQELPDESFVPFFIRAPAIKVLRERVRARGQDPADFETVWYDEKNWEAEARQTSIGFTMIDNTEDGIATAVEQIRNRLNFPFSFKRARKNLG
jgi:guanylate kinase